MRIILFIQLVTLILLPELNAQKGHIRGTIYDVTNGEYLTGVTILIEGSQNGTISDLDGKFSLTADPGIYNLSLSFISYKTQKINNVEVKAGEVTVLDEIGMQESSLELTEVVVMGQSIQDTENALLAIKRKSPNLMDGISAARLKKIGDSDAATAMKRVPGVSISGGKYVFVRGLGDRYTKTTLNGVDIPGLDPDRNALQMDIIPTNILDNLIVHKSFRAELPGDFTGGLVDITTIDFPDRKKSSISMSLGYNPDYHFNPDYLMYEGGSTDFLGFDDGTREIPATSNIPFFPSVVGNPDGESGQRFREILESFNPTMAASRQESFMDYGFGFSWGNQKELKKNTFGYNFAFSYKNNTEYFHDTQYGTYGLQPDPDNYEMTPRSLRNGDFGVNNVFVSGLAGMAFKTNNSKYRIKLLHLQNGESKGGIFDYFGRDQGSNFDAIQYNVDYSQRSLSNLLIDGKHYVHHSDWEIEWKVSPTLSLMNDPDVRFSRYQVNDDGGFGIGTEVGFPERIWRELQEVNMAGLVHITKGYNFLGRSSKLKFGASYTYKDRDYEIRTFALNIRNVPLNSNPNELFYDENLWPLNNTDRNRGTTYEARFIPNNPNQYNANVHNAGAYISTEVNLTQQFKTIAGVRFENYVQYYTGQDQQGGNVLDNDEVLNDLEILPSINMIYGVLPNMKIRGSYAKTVARPSFKELSYAEIYDPISDRLFVGGLFRDANDAIGVEYWDGELVSTDIHNVDLRWEMFMADAQMISFSGFYKKFLRPIEIVQYFVQKGAFQPRNVGDGEVYGAEMEFRINMGFIQADLRRISLLSNITYLQSRIELSDTEYESRARIARTGQETDRYRDMAGMAPIIVNGGIQYSGDQGIGRGLEAGFYYHVKGSTLEYVGTADRPDIYSNPSHSLNFNLTKKLGENGRSNLGLKIDNLLNNSNELVFKSYNAEDKYFEKINPGMSISLSFGYSFY